MKELIERKNTYNSKIYDCIVFPEVDNQHDYNMVCNELAKLYQWCDKIGGCVDAVRCCKDDNGKYTKAFASEITCCGVANKKVTNELNGNSFWVGFNYGH